MIHNQGIIIQQKFHSEQIQQDALLLV